MMKNMTLPNSGLNRLRTVKEIGWHKEITVLQAINAKDKSKIPGYLNYHD